MGGSDLEPPSIFISVPEDEDSSGGGGDTSPPDAALDPPAAPTKVSAHPPMPHFGVEDGHFYPPPFFPQDPPAGTELPPAVLPQTEALPARPPSSEPPPPGTQSPEVPPGGVPDVPPGPSEG